MACGGKPRIVQINLGGMALALAVSVGAFFIVPSLYRSQAQDEPQQQDENSQNQDDTRQMLSDPKVKQGLALMQQFQSAQTQPTTAATNP